MKRMVVCAVLILSALASAGCEVGGVPMGGRPAEGGTCDPNGWAPLQPEVCK